MAINIKNEHTVALVRELASLTGTTMTRAVEDAIAARLDELRAAPKPAEARAAQRLHEGRALVARVQSSLTDSEREALRTAQSDMYDENGLPAW